MVSSSTDSLGGVYLKLATYSFSSRSSSGCFSIGGSNGLMSGAPDASVTSLNVGIPAEAGGGVNGSGIGGLTIGRGASCIADDWA